jgi:ATP-dependent Lhr-like helicase
MAADGFATRRGRRAALLHRDEVNARVRSRRHARLLAITSGGAIPEVADYRVVLEPDDTFIGTLNEDFAIESMAGDVFQLGNLSWRVLQVGAGVVRVADAKGAPPNIPFWLGEAPGRSDELSAAVSDLRAEVDRRLSSRPAHLAHRANPPTAVVDWLAGEAGVSADAAEQAIAYLAEGRESLGVLPTQDTLVLERFFDESGGMQLVLHAPFGSRINKAWGLALRKRFCRQFNFELQAAATEEGLLLSLGPQHSFPLSDVFRYLHPATARDVLVQAFLDAPVFQTRWRWNTTISLAVPRYRGGKKVPPQLQRMLADDLMAAVFPDAAACLENIPGDRQIPDHPLVNQTVRDCLQEAMDFDGLTRVLDRIHRGELRLIARDTPEPSPLSHEILNARPYAFLDDAPLEERRAHAVYARRAGEPAGSELGALDAAAIERVRSEQRPDPRDADELHDALMTAGFLTPHDVGDIPAELFEALTSSSRATLSGRAALSWPPADVRSPADASIHPDSPSAWFAAERLPELLAIRPDATLRPPVAAPPARAAKNWNREDAIVELIRGRLTIVGPTTAEGLAAELGTSTADADAALLTLESEGVVLRGNFDAHLPHPPDRADSPAAQWCDRALLARIHRYTLNRLRAEIEPVDAADFMRFLFAWHHLDAGGRLSGIDGLRAVVGLLDGFEAPAAAWERTILPARMDRYDPGLLDLLCLTGEVGWARLSPAATSVGGATPIALFLRDHAAEWFALRDSGSAADLPVSNTASRVLSTVESRGAMFFKDLAVAAEVDGDALQGAIGELVAAGRLTADGFAGLRAIADPRVKASPAAAGRGRSARSGRWSAIDRGESRPPAESAIEAQARALLARYGVVFRRLAAREPNAVPWRVLARAYRRLEARGEIRGGRFVTGVSGEQFAVPEAVERLREVRRTAKDGRLVTISAADPLNLAGILDNGDRVRTITTHRIVYRDGIPLAALEGDYMRPLRTIEPDAAADVASALVGRRMPAVVSGFVGGES